MMENFLKKNKVKNLLTEGLTYSFSAILFLMKSLASNKEDKHFDIIEDTLKDKNGKPPILKIKRVKDNKIIELKIVFETIEELYTPTLQANIYNEKNLETTLTFKPEKKDVDEYFKKISNNEEAIKKMRSILPNKQSQWLDIPYFSDFVQKETKIVLENLTDEKCEVDFIFSEEE